MSYIFKTIETCVSGLFLAGLLLVGYVGFRAANLALPSRVTAQDLTFQVAEDQGKPWLYFWEDKRPEVEIVSVRKYAVFAVAKVRLGEDRVPVTLVSDLSDAGRWRPAPWESAVKDGGKFVLVNGSLTPDAS